MTANKTYKVAVISAGEMGAAIGERLVKAGHTVFTHLEGRSARTRQRAADAGMRDTSSFEQMVEEAEWTLSILPPRDAVSMAQRFVDAMKKIHLQGPGSIGAQPDCRSQKVYIDCNAVSPITAKRIAAMIRDDVHSRTTFLDAGIIGGPPNDSYASHIYAAADPSDDKAQKALDEFAKFKCGIKITALKGDGIDVGAASALKVSYAGITKGTTGLICTMILAAHAYSPSTSQALLQEMKYSQPQLVRRIVHGVPASIPKAYRWVAEMEEIASFVDATLKCGSRSSSSCEDKRFDDVNGVGQIHRGMASIFQHLETALETDGKQEGDIKTLLSFAKNAEV